MDGRKFHWSHCRCPAGYQAVPIQKERIRFAGHDLSVVHQRHGKGEIVIKDRRHRNNLPGSLVTEYAEVIEVEMCIRDRPWTGEPS